MEEDQVGYTVYVIDTETTGTDHTIHDIIELSACRLIPVGDSYKEEQRTWLIKATHPATITDKALQINGHKREDIIHLTKEGRKKYLLPEVFLEQFEEWVMEDNVSSIDRIFSGQHPTFDLLFLKELYKRLGKIDDNDFPFFVENNNRILDTKQIMIFFDICTGRRRKYYNLSALVKALGVKKTKAHRADEDTRMTKDVLMAQVSIVKDSVKSKIQNTYENE